MDQLQTEGRNPASHDLDRLSPLELVRLMSSEDARVPAAVAAQAPAIAQAIEVVAERLARGGRLIYCGAGTSGRLGVLDATECPPTFNSPPGLVLGLIAGGPQALTRAVEGAEDQPELAEADLQAINLSAADVLVGIATSGRTPWVQGAIRFARQRGAYTIGLSCNPDSELIPRVDLAITPVVGPEVLTGSTRLKAGTATKLVLNILSTGVMVRLGKTFGNLMVDLRATNSKLRARANRIVRTLTGLDAGQAGELLVRCGGELKTALVSHLAGISPEQARQRLEQAGGQVRQALQSLLSAPDRMRDDLLLGIDGGGTSTVALLAQREAGSQAWRTVGVGQGGASNPHAVGLAVARANIDAAVASAFQAARLPRCRVGVAFLGLAGTDRPGERQEILAWAESANLARKVGVGSDAELLLTAGTPAGWGVALVAGTGSIAWGRTEDGRSARAGGWGPLLGDEGSAYRLGLDALRGVVRATDGRGPATALTAALLAQLGLSSVQELVPWIYSPQRERASIAALAPLVLKLAGRDNLAARVVRRGAAGLARCVAAVVAALGLPADFPLALAGGLLESSRRYRGLLRRELQRLNLRPATTVVDQPARGAILLALRLIS